MQHSLGCPLREVFKAVVRSAVGKILERHCPPRTDAHRPSAPPNSAASASATASAAERVDNSQPMPDKVETTEAAAQAFCLPSDSCATAVIVESGDGFLRGGTEHQRGPPPGGPKDECHSNSQGREAHLGKPDHQRHYEYCSDGHAADFLIVEAESIRRFISKLVVFEKASSEGKNKKSTHQQLAS